MRIRLAMFTALTCLSMFALSPVSAHPETSQPIKVKSTVGDLVIPQGATATYDASKGPLRVQGRFENHGTLQIIGDVRQAQIEASGLQNDGVIISNVLNLTFQNNGTGPFALNLKAGTIKAPDAVGFVSTGDIELVGGDLTAERVIFTADKALKIGANSLNGKVELSAENIAVGVNKGNLIITKQVASGDPLYYNFSGDLSVPSFSYSGTTLVDFVAVASGNVTVGDVSTTGAIRLAAGVNFHLQGTLPTSGGGSSAPMSDADCVVRASMSCSPATIVDSFASSAQLITGSLNSEGYHVSLESSDSITVNGNLTSQTNYVLSSSKGNVTINGNIDGHDGVSIDTQDNGSIAVNGSITSVFGVFSAWADTGMPYSSSAKVTVTGNINVLEAEIFAGGDISVENIYAGSTSYAGAIRLHTNLSGNISEFVIGTSSGSNHALALFATTDTGGSAPQTSGGGTPLWDQTPLQYVGVENKGSGGITIENGAAISVASLNSDAGAILLNADSGNIKLKGGTLSAAGSSTSKAGQIVLRAQRVELTNNSVIDASNYGLDGSNHYVLIAARQFFYSGGATINVNGDSGSDIKDGAIFNIDTGTVLNLGGILPHIRQFDVNNGSLQFYSPDNTTLNVYTYGKETGSYFAANPISFYGNANFLAYGEDTKQTIHYPGTSPSGATSLSFDYGAVNFYADGNNADAGTVTIEADAIAGSNDSTVSFNARAFGTGNGGTVAISAESIALEGTSFFDARSDSSGDGGEIQLDMETSLAFSMASFNADAADSGTGGSIKLRSTDELDMSTIVSISALGGVNGGAGGHVELSNPTPFNVNTLIAVESDGGDGDCCVALRKSAPKLFVNSDSGSIKILNTVIESEVTCKQYANSTGDWPKSFWDCTGGTPSQIQNDAMQHVPAQARFKLSEDDVDIYTFATRDDAVNFFGLNTLGANVGLLASGYTGDILGKTYSMVFEAPFFGNQVRETETSVHEIGHALDYAYKHQNSGLQSTSNTYIGFAYNDFLRLDYSALGSDELSSTYRDPCSGLDAPLIGVIDRVTGQQFCSSGVLNDPVGAYAGKTNSEIIRLSDGGIFAFSSLDPNSSGFSELYAQAFAFAAYANQNVGTVSNLTHSTADLLINSNLSLSTGKYMECTFAWGNALASDAFTPPSSPAYCSNTTPNWYAPFGSKTH